MGQIHNSSWDEWYQFWKWHCKRLWGSLFLNVCDWEVVELFFICLAFMLLVASRRTSEKSSLAVNTHRTSLKHSYLPAWYRYSQFIPLLLSEIPVHRCSWWKFYSMDICCFAFHWQDKPSLISCPTSGNNFCCLIYSRYIQHSCLQDCQALW